MASCLSCAELETKICDLAAKLASDPGCAGIKKSEAGISHDTTAQLQGMRTALDVYRQMWDDKDCASQATANQLYEFVQTPCISQVSCGTTCRPTRRIVSGRRYRQ